MVPFTRNLIATTLALTAVAVAGPNVQPERFVAVLENGDRVVGAMVDNWARPGDKPRLGARPLTDPANPLRWLCDTSLDDAGQPEAFVEFVTGDRLAGTVVQTSDSDDESSSVCAWPYLVIEPNPLQHLRNSRNVASRRLRVVQGMVRRVVWQAGRGPLHESNMLRRRDGRMVRFRGVRFRNNSVLLLLDRSTVEIQFDEIAELNLAQAQPYDACLDELTVLSPDLAGRLMQVETASGMIATTSERRFRPMPYNDRENPDQWYHLIHPAWSLDAFAVPCCDIRLRRYFHPEQVPLTRIKPVRTENRSVICSAWRYRKNLNVLGHPLASGGRTYGWGFGVHGDSRLEFMLPPIATAFRAEVGIDRNSGTGGCVRTVVLLQPMAASSPPRAKGPPITLHTSSVLVGSQKTADTGVLKFPANRIGHRRLVLSVDPMNRNHPAGADPLDIRDSLDWLEPMVQLDRDALATEVRRRLTQCIPAWRGWSLGGGLAAGVRMVGHWDAMSGQGANYRFAVSTDKGAGTLILTRKVTVTKGNVQLAIVAARLADMSDPAVIKVAVDGRQVAAADLSIRYTGDEEPAPLRISLDEWTNHDVVLTITLTPKKANAAKLVIDWRAIAFTGRGAQNVRATVTPFGPRTRPRGEDWSSRSPVKTFALLESTLCCR